MRNVKVLEMLNDGKIEELKSMLQDEIYQESLKAKPDAKKRYMAMKKYFTYCDSVREVLQKPCEVEVDGQKYISFCNNYSLVLTKESTGEIKLFDTSKGNYPDISRLVRYNGNVSEIDISRVFAEAKSKGYKLKKAELGYNYQYVMKYDGSYFKIGLLDATYGIIDDGKEARVYHVEGPNNPLTITTDIGVAYIMPIRCESKLEDEGKVVVYVDC